MRSQYKYYLQTKQTNGSLTDRMISEAFWHLYFISSTIILLTQSTHKDGTPGGFVCHTDRAKNKL